MRRFGFLLSRRWVLFGLTVIVLVMATIWLGNWQFDRLDARKQSNATVKANEHKAPAPAGDVMSTDQGVAEQDEWRLVKATGHYDVDNTIVVRYRTRDESAGVDIVVPLVTADGTAVLVDRGWMATANNHADDLDIPDPPSGEVHVTGYLRADGSGSSTDVDDHSTRAINAEKIGDATGLPVYDGFLSLSSEDPEPAEALAAEPLPELDNGPHFFYGLQWWFFGVLAVTGFFYLLYDESRSHRRRQDAQPASAQPTSAQDADGVGVPAPEKSTPEPAAPLTERQARRRAKAAKKQAVRDAYKAAYERERSQR